MAKQPIEKTIIDLVPGAPRPQGKEVLTGAITEAPDILAPAKRFVASGRPAVPRLCVLDDSSDADGEWFWVRERIFSIGRMEGMVRIGHDPDISAKHARIERIVDDGEESWKLVDESSTNGTFVRISQIELGNDNELRMGSSFYRWSQSLVDGKLVGYLQILDGSERGWTFDQATTFILGRSKQSRCHLGEDPCLDGSHASLSFAHNDRWVIRDLDSLNGIWLRVQEWRLVNGSEFMLGGQRLVFQVASKEKSQQ